MRDHAELEAEKFACLNSFDGLTVSVRRVLPGMSGACVAIVSVATSASREGQLYIAKISSQGHIEREAAAYDLANEAFGDSVPRIYARSQIVNGFGAVLMEIAHGTILSPKPLADYIRDQPLNNGSAFLRQLVKQLLDWPDLSNQQISHSPNIDASFSPISEGHTPYEMLRLALDRKDGDRVSGAQSVGTRIKQALGIDESTFRLDLGPINKPNPLAYIQLESLWDSYHARMKWDFPHFPSHGDLHTQNILCLEGTGPIIIDWATFEPRGLALFDIAYIEVDVILKLMPFCKNMRSHWHPLLNALTASISLQQVSDPDLPFEIVGLEAQTTYHLISVIREQVSAYCRSDAQKLAWWISCVAAGLNWTRKQPVNTTPLRPTIHRAAALMYSAYALDSLLELLDIPGQQNAPLASLGWYDIEEAI